MRVVSTHSLESLATEITTFDIET